MEVADAVRRIWLLGDVLQCKAIVMIILRSRPAYYRILRRHCQAVPGAPQRNEMDTTS